MLFPSKLLDCRPSNKQPTCGEDRWG